MDIICANFNNLTANPDKFLSSGQLSGELKSLLKKVYDLCLQFDRTSTKALPALIIKHFDDEQIWQELELQNEDSLPKLINKVAKLVTIKNLVFPVKTTKSSNVVKDAKNKIKEKEVKKKSEAISSDEESDFENEDLDEEDLSGVESDEELLNKPKTVKIVPSEVDDKFFKLSEAEAFLDEQEKEENGLGVDLFNGMDSDSESERPMYGDFFEESTENYDESHNYKDNIDHNEDQTDEEEVESEEEDEEDGNKKVKFNLNDDKFEYDSASDSSHDDEPKSSFQMREEKLRKKIEDLEDEALQDKPWTLKGETNADTRPVNSLLEEVVEFDMTRRPAPVVTEETSNRLEDIIKRRIRDKAFNDVERKVKPVDTPYEFKKKLVLDQEKSKQSLAEVYEKEFLKQKADQNQGAEKVEVEPEEHQVISNMMKSLFTKLDALSNFFFVPKPSAPDLKIVNNLPAVEVEEVAPVTTSDAKLLAPEEIGGSYRKSLLGKEEKTKTDRNRERRKKKQHQAKVYEKKNKDNKKVPTYKEELKKALKYKNVSTLDETSSKTKSSTDFFTKLQYQVKEPQNLKKRKNKSNAKSAKKLKL